MKKSIIVVVILLMILGVAMYFYVDDRLEESFSTDVNIEKVSFEEVGANLYLKQKVWGMTSDSKVTIISTNSFQSFEEDPNAAYVYSSGSTLFFRTVNDTLEIFSMTLAKEPSNFDSRIKVRQVRISNPEFIFLNENYKKEGLSRFPQAGAGM